MPKKMLIASVLFAGIVCSFLIARATAADAKPAGFSAQMTTWTALKTAHGAEARVNLLLEGGAQYSAKIKDLGTAAVVLKEPTGKEFYEVYVPLDKIVAIELKVR